MCENTKINNKTYTDYANKFNQELYSAFENGEKFSKSIAFKIRNRLSFSLLKEENKIFYQRINLKDSCSGTDLTQIIDFKEYPDDTKSLSIPFLNFSFTDPKNCSTCNPNNLVIDAITFNSTGNMTTEDFLDIIRFNNLFELLTSYAEKAMYKHFLSLFVEKLSSLPYEKAEKNQDKTKMNLYTYFNYKNVVDNLKICNDNKMTMLTSGSICFDLFSGRKKDAFEDLKYISSYHYNRIPDFRLKDGFVYLGDFQSIFRSMVSSSYNISVDFSTQKNYSFNFTYFCGLNNFPNVQQSISLINFAG